jgi:iron-sulfur cluster assembly protein
VEEQKKISPPALTITEKAFAAIREVIDSQKVPDGYQLRVGIRSQGMACAGMSFMLGFDKKKEEDMELEVAGMQVLVDRRHSMYVMGMEIDWHEDENQRGFVFNNPTKRRVDDIFVRLRPEAE